LTYSSKFEKDRDRRVVVYVWKKGLLSINIGSSESSSP